jgi:hypothetical protein
VYLPNLWAMSLNYEIRSWSDPKSRRVYPRFGRVQSGIVVGRATLLWEELPTKRPLCETWARMSHADPNGPPDRRPIKVGEVWENPVTGNARSSWSVPGTTLLTA